MDPDSRRKICAGLSPEAPPDPSFQVASTTVAIHKIHAALHDFGSSDESSEVEVSDSENTTDPDHDLQVNQARANGQASRNGRKYDNASEVSPGHPARMMSSKKGRWNRRKQ